MAAISVLMAVYNCDKYLRQAVDSILNQTWKDFEFIIVDDGSTDGTSKILKELNDPRIKIITCEENRGVAHARNIGLKDCNSDYIAIMDADDIAFPDRLKRQYEFLMEHKDIDGAYAKFQQVNIEGMPVFGEWPVAYYNYKYVKAYMILENTIANPVSMFSNKIVKQYNLKYDETQKIGSDYKFWIDYLKYGKIVGMDEVLCYYRLRNHSLYNNSSLEDRLASKHKLALYIFGQFEFEFTDEEKDILINSFGVNGKISSAEEMIRLYNALIRMAKQAEEKGLDNAEEIKIMCKKRFLEKIQQADEIWKW